MFRVIVIDGSHRLTDGDVSIDILLSQVCGRAREHDGRVWNSSVGYSV